MTIPARSLEQATILRTGSIRDAMLALEHGTFSLVMVIDEGRRLVGVVTDGDLRRALLRGASIEDPVSTHMVTSFVAVDTRASRAEVIELMHARTIAQVPVIDAAGVLVGLHLLRDVIGPPVRPNWVVIMAGGRGARLAPLTDQVPKPMLRVAGRPILERIVLHLVGQGLRRIFLSINYLGHMIREHFGDGSQLGAAIEYIEEDRPLGTGGALSLLPEVPTAPLLVMNGDLVTQADVGSLLAFHERTSPAATVAIRKYFHTVPFGCVEVEDDRIVRLEEKPTLSRLVNAGIYVLSPALITTLPRGTATSVPEILGNAMLRGDDVRAYEIDDEWIDVGHRDQLSAARSGS